MKAFKIVPSIAEYVDFRTLAKELSLGERDLILTNEYIYNPTIAALNLGCHTCFQAQPAVSGVRDFFHRCDGSRGGELSLSECVCTERAVLRQGAAPYPVLLEGCCCSGRQGCVEEACT